MLAKTPEESIASVKLKLEDYLYAKVGGRVLSGPFKGMQLLRDVTWRETYLPPLLLGCYEEELHGVIDQQINRLNAFERTPNIVVVGCAEGYYATGLACRIPKARVYAIDNDDTAVEITNKTAKANGATLRTGCPLGEVFEAPDFVVMDCEGAEVEYLDLDKFPALANAHIVVEIHNYKGQKTDDILLERFRGTHRITLIAEGPRNPNNYMQLCPLSSDTRWMAVSEGRPCLMGWYSMTPRGMSIK